MVYYICYHSITMFYNTTVTKKGQATIPAEIRKKLGIEPYEQITFITINDLVVIKPAKDFLSLKGSIESNKKFHNKKTNKSVLEYKKKEYEEKLRNC